MFLLIFVFLGLSRMGGNSNLNNNINSNINNNTNNAYSVTGGDDSNINSNNKFTVLSNESSTSLFAKLNANNGIKRSRTLH